VRDIPHADFEVNFEWGYALSDEDRFFGTRITRMTRIYLDLGGGIEF